MTNPFYETDPAAAHDAHYSDYARNAAPLLLERLARAGHHDGTVVDLGCGSGVMARLVSDAGYDVIGVDMSADMIELARRRAPAARFTCGSLWNFQLPAAVAVTAIGEVLSYVSDPRAGEPALAALFRAVHAALEPGGVFLFDVAAPGRAGPEGLREGFDDHPSYSVYSRASETAARTVLERRIVLFRRDGEHYRRSDEVHRLRLFEPEKASACSAKAGST
jgi:SAM-dependent methyltransferase